jgi:hypothetical protein
MLHFLTILVAGATDSSDALCWLCSAGTYSNSQGRKREREGSTFRFARWTIFANSLDWRKVSLVGSDSARADLWVCGSGLEFYLCIHMSVYWCKQVNIDLTPHLPLLRFRRRCRVHALQRWILLNSRGYYCGIDAISWFACGPGFAVSRQNINNWNWELMI